MSRQDAPSVICRARFMEEGETMKKIITLMLAIMVAMTVTASPVSAAVDGITKDNYMEYEKTYPDAYGYNKGEADIPYMEGEEYFYDEYVDHWNVDRVYDAALIPSDWNKQADTPKKVKKPKKSKKNKRLGKSKH